MREVRYSTAAKKDLKRYRRDPRKMQALFAALRLILSGQPLPARYRAHCLKRQYEGCFECHVGPDFLLVWETPDGVLEVVRIGSHAELFG